jgi:hypothetical protein
VIRIRHRRSTQSRVLVRNAGFPGCKFIRFEPAALPVCSARGGVRTRASSASVQADSFARMPKPIAYIETTIPNFYYDLRTSEAVTTRRAWTREWWASAPSQYDLVTSEEVLIELSAGRGRWVPLRLELLDKLPMLPLGPEVAEIVQTYLRHKLMPANPGGDAVHLALASSYRCDFIVTWNCKHLANPNKSAHIHRINQMLGLSVPMIVTPLELLGRAQ